MLVAVGQAIVIITRNVDLSVGSVARPHRVPHRAPVHRHARHPADRGVPRSASCFGGLLGLINGALVAFAKVPALVITLGTLYIYRGINVAWTGGDRINASDLPARLPRRSAPARSSASRSSRSSPLVVLDRRRLVPAQPAQRPRALRDRLRPRRRAPLRPAGDPARARRVRRLAARWRASPACCTPPATARSARGAGIGLGAAGDRRGRHRRRRDLGRRRHRLGCRDRRRTCCSPSTAPCRSSASTTSGSAPSSARSSSARSCSTASSRSDSIDELIEATGGGHDDRAPPSDDRAPRASTSAHAQPAVAPRPAHPRDGDHRPARHRHRRRARRRCRNFDSPLTVTYLLRDVAPILLIALPMTLIIITEEIDLSVASIVGLSSVMTGILTKAGWPFAAAALTAILVGARRRRGQRLPRHRRRAALARRHDRHARAVPRHRGRPARHDGDHRLPRVLDRPREGEHPRHADPGAS